MSWCRSRWLYDEPHKSVQYPLCPIWASWRARLCVCVWGGAIVMRQQGTPSQMVRFISYNPNPITISALALHFTWFNVAMCLCTHKIIAHKNECGCQFVHVHVCVDVCMVYVCVCVWIFVSLTKCVCLDVCVFAATGTCMQVCMCACTLKFLEKRHGENCGPMLV